MLDRLQQIILQKTGRVRKTEYPAELIAQMELLPTMRNVADELQQCSDEVSKKFHLAEESSSNKSENLAMPLKVLISQIIDHKEYADFLKSQSEMYDAIGSAQRNFYTEIQDKVTNPLKTWVISDYDRIKNSIDLLNSKRWEMDLAIADFEKCSEQHKTAKGFKAEQAKKDYEMQLAMVKADLNKIPAIQIDQATCLKNFNELCFKYHKQVETILEKHGANKV